jgi:hypothetical protein
LTFPTGEKVYHVNPETNRPNICRSEPGKCSVATRAKHYETLDEAKEALAKQKSKPAAKKTVKVKDEAPAVEVTPVEVKEDSPVEDSELAEAPPGAVLVTGPVASGKSENATDIIDLLIADSLRDKTEDELRPKRPAGFFENLSENSANLAKKAAQEAEEFKDSVTSIPKNPKVAETTDKLKTAAADGFNKLESLGKTSFGKLKGAFGKKKK